ncbi:hypothetical protein QA640_27260 [Bradyrhizobium sp. CB82]|uniref:hypothetical protein n=1 Tax=Bradyrhizobium sp. CB82 TaxID=3039159 RepID=UPI0024B25B55|nr:hypothetical protein [Bradyrhizobium sp. CB82]WFU38123.1 hypothetical protein QA640_27260 [Bradyrhizobium sp. CB82]
MVKMVPAVKEAAFGLGAEVFERADFFGAPGQFESSAHRGSFPDRIEVGTMVGRSS